FRYDADGNGTIDAATEDVSTADINFDASEAAVQLALANLPNIGRRTVNSTTFDNVAVQKTGTSYMVAFLGPLAGTEVPALTVPERDKPEGSQHTAQSEESYAEGEETCHGSGRSVG